MDNPQQGIGKIRIRVNTNFISFTWAVIRREEQTRVPAISVMKQNAVRMGMTLKKEL